MLDRRRPHRPRASIAALFAVPLIAVMLAPAAVLAATPVRVLPSAGISIDGSNADWDRDADFLAEMYEAGKPDHPVLLYAYARYDCGTGTMYVFVDDPDLRDRALEFRQLRQDREHRQVGRRIVRR